MESKRGRSGARNGRTLRSRFAQSRGNRSEGLLVHSSVVNCSSRGGNDEEKVITYSLGKQNRWLLPEVIKESKARSTGFEDRECEEVVLVERYTNARKRGQPECISVFNSKNGTIRKPKRKLAQAKDLLRDSEEVESRYEVAYPHPSGSRLKNTKRPAGHLGKRKKNSSTRRIVDDELDDLSEIEYPDSDGNEDFSEQLIWQRPRLDLDVLIKSSSKISPKAYASEISIPHCHPQHKQSKQEGRCIFVESDQEMQEMHLEYLTQIEAGCSLLDARDQIIKRNQELKRKERKRSRKPRNPDNKSTNESAPLAETCPALPLKPVHPDGCEGVVVKMRRQDTMPESLAEQWSHMYKESASYPRAFVLNVAPVMSLSNSKEAFIVFRIIEDHARFSAGEAQALVSIVVSNDENNSEKTLTDFKADIKRRSAEKEIWTLEDIANVAICCLEGHFNNANVKVDYKEPRKPRLSMEVFTYLFGWKSKTFSSQAAKQQLKERLAKVNGMTNTTTVAAVSDDNQEILECGICFQEMKDKGELIYLNMFEKLLLL